MKVCVYSCYGELLSNGVPQVDVKKKAAKGKGQKNKVVEENDNVITIPESLTDLKDDAFVLIPVSFNHVNFHGFVWIF